MEAASKNRRGRPCTPVGELAKKIASLWSDRGTRVQVNRAYEQQAFQLLGDIDNGVLLRPEFQWLNPPGGKMRHGLLEQIGRLRVAGGDTIALMAADRLCQEKPKTKDAETWLRAVRAKLRES